ncbi:MAG: ComF family protein [Acetivibrionales bacterium]|nr:ComF family protein [Bacillota bacterium]HOA54352.1 ComF family protein [Clostridiales bacterium]HPZ04892.1 ComF family protein [Clostridiales bacterium]
MKLFESVLNLIYPPKCIFCGQILDYSAVIHICGSCFTKLPFSDSAIIRPWQEDEENYCDGALSVFEYTGMVKESLIRFKFYNKPGYYRTYARLIADKLNKLTNIKEYDMVMSVPLHKHKEFIRGYNQAYLISKALSRLIKLRECSKVLKRERYTESQSLLDRQKRNQNVRGAFSVKLPKKVNGKSILLVDDILTTGSTLEECSRVLKQAGAVKVFAVVVATGRK